ncbi:MAG: GldG family protein [Alphaproteobacteria bacterium]|nr:GldG family protein [Alphaproteobacteria bacterium]
MSERRMPERRSPERRTVAIASLVLLLVLLVAVNAISNRLFSGMVLDFTEDKLFTLSDGTRQILKEIDEPITLRFYYSEKLGKTVPSFVPYVNRVRELLERYRDLAGGKIRLEIYNPEPFSDIEDKAVGAGLQGIPVNRTASENAYFGLVGTNSTDDEETITFFNPSRERFLEYDLTRLIARLAKPKKKVVGLMSTMPLGEPRSRVNRFGKPWTIIKQLSARFTLRQVRNETGPVDSKLDVLMVVHPKRLTPAALYAIDQYVLRGGKAIFFIDPHAETAGRQSRFGLNFDTGSDLPGLLEAWGVEVVKDRVVGDPSVAVRVRTPGTDGRPQQIVEYLVWMGLGKRNINRDDIVTTDLRRINIASAGIIRKTKGSKIDLVPLLISSPQSMQIDANLIRFRPDILKLAADFKSGGQVLIMAARLRGKVKSAFPKGPPAAPAKKKGKDSKKPAQKDTKKKDAKKKDAKKEAKAKHLTQSLKGINIVIIADTDLMDDRFWVSQRAYFGRQVTVAVADNGAFIINALDNLAGSGALIGLRSRGQAARPFTLVQDIQRKASLRLRAKERDLVEKLKQARGKLAELRSKTDATGKSILSPAQIKAIVEFRDDVLRTRRELRAVQLAMRRDIDRLETRLQFLTIGALPILIALIALLVSLVRGRRRRRRYAVTQSRG